MIGVYLSLVLAIPPPTGEPPVFDRLEPTHLEYVGPASLIADFKAGLAVPRALAHADFDRDGILDVAVVYDTPTGPAIGLLRGNVGAIYPHLRYSDDGPFAGPMRVTPIGVRGDHIQAGDFDADGRPDLVIGNGSASRLVLVPNAGPGQWGDPLQRRLPGPVSTISVGQFGRFDDLPDLAFGIKGWEGGTFVMSSPNGAWSATPERLTDDMPLDIVLGAFDQGPSMDAALVSTGELVVIRGEGRIDRLALNVRPHALAAGDFLEATGQEIAITSGEGTLVVQPGNMTVRQWTDQRGTGVFSTRSTGGKGDDLIVTSGATLTMIPHGLLEQPAFSETHLPWPAASDHIRMQLDSPIRGLVPMRLNVDALQDLAVITTSISPVAIRTRAAAVFTVNSADSDADGDTDDGICDIGPDGDGNLIGVCTLAAAIDQANASGGADVINFAIPGTGPFSLGGIGSEITGPTTIDGTTQPGYSGTPLIVLPDQSLSLMGGNSVVRGVTIYQSDPSFQLTLGIDMTDAGGNILEASFIGVDPTGTVTNPDGVRQSGDELGAFASGIWVRTANNTIGGAAEAARNIISGTVDGDGILIAGVNATGNVVEGNYIGTDVTGQVALGNSIRGVSISELASANTVRGNLISGNGEGGDALFTGAGVALQRNPIWVDPVNGGDGPPAGNLIYDNLIGTNADGTAALPNIRGIIVDEGLNNTIGSAVDSLRNVISGNTREGIKISGNFGDTSGNTVTGNHVGMNSAGTSEIPNGTDGILVEDAPSTTIGGASSGQGNLISGNTSRGLALIESASSLVAGNRIGTDIQGLLARGNGSSGIQITGPGAVTVGTGTPAGANVIGANGGGGIFISGNASGIVIKGNYIGTDASAQANLGNSFDGVRILGQTGHVIGGTQEGDGNVIAYNALNGVMVFNGSGYTINRNTFFGNGNLAIDLANDGVTPNDAGDADEGQNGLQNYPVLGFLDSERVRVSLNSTPSTAFRFEFFANVTCDDSDYGEGERFLRAESRTTDALGEVEFETTFALEEDEDFVTATVTGPDGSTSEFSRCSDDLRLIVNTVADRSDGDTSDPVCDTGVDVVRSGEEEPECTLRAAIEQAAANDGSDEITFDIIDGSAPYTISPGTPYDWISETVTIDATTQTGYASQSPAVALDGGGSVEFGLRFDGGAPSVSALSISNFTVGLRSTSGPVTLHDLLFNDNGNLGLWISGDDGQTSTASGLLRVNGNGMNDSPACGGSAGIALDGSLTSEALEVTNNCGHGVLATTGTVTVNGNATVSDNAGWGFRVRNLVLDGTEHTVGTNGDGAIGAFTVSTGTVSIAGAATINDNGPLTEPSCDEGDEGAVIAGSITTEAVTVSGNCGNGLFATDGDVIVNGNATILDNRVKGIRALNSVRLTGDEHTIQSNGDTGLAGQNEDVVIVGTAVVQFNGDEIDEQACSDDRTAAVFASQDIQAEDILAHDNCGHGLLADGTITVSERLRVTSNGAAGAQATRGSIIVGGDGHVASGNGRQGLEARGAGAVVRLTGSLEASRNDSSGVVGSTVDLGGATGAACANGRFGVEVRGGELAIGGITVCDNALGGIRSQSASSGKTSAVGSISGATIVGNAGDGVRFEGGAVFGIANSNLFGNAGFAVNNLDPAATLVADGNWWGDSAGPGSAVSGNVTVTSFLTAPVVEQDSDGDGLANEIENQGPNGGDWNADSIPDALQPNIAALPSATDGRRILIEASAPMSSVHATQFADVATASFPQGFVDLTAEAPAGSGAATVSMAFPRGSRSYSELIGYLPTVQGGNPEIYHYVDATVTDTMVSLTVVDGAVGDADLVANGSVRIVAGLVLESGVSIEPGLEIPRSLRISVYPNPVLGQATLSYASNEPGPLEIEVFDVLGRMVHGFGAIREGSGNLHLNAGSWPPGVYFIVLSSPGGRQTTPILRVR